MKPNNVFFVPCTENSFFRAWIEFFGPCHMLSSRQMDVAGRILAQYFKLKNNGVDPAVINEVLWSHRSRMDMISSLGMSSQQFQNITRTLRSRGVLKEQWQIEPKYIPHMSGDPRHMLAVVFDWSSDDNKIDATKQD